MFLIIVSGDISQSGVWFLVMTWQQPGLAPREDILDMDHSASLLENDPNVGQVGADSDCDVVDVNITVLCIPAAQVRLRSEEM